MTKTDLISGFSEEETQRVITHIERLMPHLNLSKIIVVGGLAIRYHVYKAGLDNHFGDVNDLDLVAYNYQAVNPSVVKDFMIYHIHPPRKEDGLFYIVLVDPVSKVKVDIFSPNAWEETIKVKFGDYDLKVAAVEDQLVKTTLDINRISEEAHVDPKQFAEMKVLAQIADMEKANIIWQSRHFSKYPNFLKDAIERAEKIANEHPQWVQKHPFKRGAPYKCSYCVNTLEFPLTPMEKIFKQLGYVE